MSLTKPTGWPLLRVSSMRKRPSVSCLRHQCSRGGFGSCEESLAASDKSQCNFEASAISARRRRGSRRTASRRTTMLISFDGSCRVPPDEDNKCGATAGWTEIERTIIFDKRRPCAVSKRDLSLSLRCHVYDLTSYGGRVRALPFRPPHRPRHLSIPASGDNSDFPVRPHPCVLVNSWSECLLP